MERPISNLKFFMTSLTTHSMGTKRKLVFFLFIHHPKVISMVDNIETPGHMRVIDVLAVFTSAPPNLQQVTYPMKALIKVILATQ